MGKFRIEAEKEAGRKPDSQSLESYYDLWRWFTEQTDKIPKGLTEFLKIVG